MNRFLNCGARRASGDGDPRLVIFNCEMFWQSAAQSLCCSWHRLRPVNPLTIATQRASSYLWVAPTAVPVAPIGPRTTNVKPLTSDIQRKPIWCHPQTDLHRLSQAPRPSSPAGDISLPVCVSHRKSIRSSPKLSETQSPAGDTRKLKTPLNSVSPAGLRRFAAWIPVVYTTGRDMPPAGLKKAGLQPCWCHPLTGTQAQKAVGATHQAVCATQKLKLIVSPFGATHRETDTASAKHHVRPARSGTDCSTNCGAGRRMWVAPTAAPTANRAFTLGCQKLPSSV